MRSTFCEGHTYFGPFSPLEPERAESVHSQGPGRRIQPLHTSLFTGVRGSGMPCELRLEGVSEVRKAFHLRLCFIGYLGADESRP